MSSSTQDFITSCLHGEAILDDIDDFIDAWHDGEAGTNQELHEYLGMTPEEYGLWVEDSGVLPFIIDARRHGITLKQSLDEFYHLPMAARAGNKDEAEKLLNWLKKTDRL